VTNSVTAMLEAHSIALAYARHALDLEETRVLALVLEAIRDPAALRGALHSALEQDIPVVLLSVGASQARKALVNAGVLIEIFSERSVVLPPVTRCAALAITSRLRLAAVLAGSRGQPPADLGAIADAITALSGLACELGDVVAALDINPLICGPSGAVAADVLAVPSARKGQMP
jgi:acetate---CoA ligase (ADP-forming)